MKILFKKLLKSKILEFLFIGLLVLGFLAFTINNHVLNYYTTFILYFLFKSLVFGSLIMCFILICRRTIQSIKSYRKGFLGNLKKIVDDIFPLKVSKASFFFSGICFLFSFVLMYFAIFRLTMLLFSLGIFFLFKDSPFIKCWLADSNQQDLKINEEFCKKYSKVYYVTKFCKLFCFIYFVYFFIRYSSFEALLNTDCLNKTLNEFIKIFEPLYLIFLIFINAVFMDFFLECTVVLFDATLISAPGTSGAILRRASKTALVAVGGGGVAGAAVSYSPMVELPGVNESQIRFGRGYGYRTAMDWGKGNILNSYFDKSVVKSWATKYGTDNILDGKSYNNMIKHEPEIRTDLNKYATAWEQRVMGIRKF